ncbi:MAG: hypothetical protein H6752_20690 [Candidatus Omnitrophica bacterium]|nr:hypothetical protein [Candidatus Omnitrophota bacterium]
MIGEKTFENLGVPDLTVGRFQIWIHGWQFESPNNPYDSDWLRVTAHCGEGGASVWVSGSIVMASDIERFGEECEWLWGEGKGSATLDPMEPELSLEVQTTDSLGQLEVIVKITPDIITQSHLFKFEIDQSHLPAISKQCAAIREKFAVRIDYPNNCD